MHRIHPPFRSQIRQPGHFWHNIGIASDKWWHHLVQAGQIATCFDGQPGDQSEKILRNYIQGDTIIAYATKHGAVGWGVIKNPASYRLLKAGCKDDVRGGELLHRLDIE